VEKQIAETQSRIESKKRMLNEVNIQYVRTKALLERNAKRQRLRTERGDSSNSCEKLYFPFLIVKADKKQSAEIKSGKGKHKYLLGFTGRKVEILNDFDIISELDLEKSAAAVKAAAFIVGGGGGGGRSVDDPVF